MKVSRVVEFVSNVVHDKKKVYLRAAFTPVAPQSVRTQSSCQYLFTLLGSTNVKAVHRKLMKLSPGVNFINIFHESIFCTKVSSKPNSKQRKNTQFAFAQKMCA